MLEHIESDSLRNSASMAEQYSVESVEGAEAEEAPPKTIAEVVQAAVDASQEDITSRYWDAHKRQVASGSARKALQLVLGYDSVQDLRQHEDDTDALRLNGRNDAQPQVVRETRGFGEILPGQIEKWRNRK